MSKLANILLAEDDENLGYVIMDQLTALGFQVVHAKDGAQGLLQFESGSFDLCLVDVMMPGLDGFSLVEKIRTKDEFIPIIFLTAKSLEEDRLRGFEIGGDDYVTKPFSMAELAYRIKVFLRRKGAPIQKAAILNLGQLEFDIKNLQIVGGIETINLTQMEADLLEMLLVNKEQLVKREDILVQIWGENDYFKGRSLDVFISRLRKYLKSDSGLEIRNNHGVGFTLLDHNLSR
ncbi:MAG: DNA-binding response OmpR family regulator [Cyclobacteriaceae bacterium]|jgi:DNA-binding response OmpR family regulator